MLETLQKEAFPLAVRPVYGTPGYSFLWRCLPQELAGLLHIAHISVRALFADQASLRISPYDLQYLYADVRQVQQLAVCLQHL